MSTGRDLEGFVGVLASGLSASLLGEIGLGQGEGLALPDPSRVSRDPAFGEADQLRALFGGFSNQSTCLRDRCVEIQPHRFGLGDGDADC